MSDADDGTRKPLGEDEPSPTANFDGQQKGPGSRIGSFRIERELGRGAVGVVYLAHDTKLDRPVAIKSLPAEVMSNPKARSRFAREARVLASLNHPNIATIYEEIEEAQGLGYLILEYVPGQTLAERIAKGPLELQEVLSIALQIADAVAAAHEHDVIHRDLKPANIKITPEGKVKVLDFGLAKAVGGKALDQQSTVTEPGRVIGTPAYMSPEQARGKPSDKRSDIWSFGCVLYEMLTGKAPFKGETISDTLANILDHDAEFEALPAEAGPQVRKLLYKCLEKDPDSRYQSAAQIRQDLYSYQATLSAKAFDVRVVWRAIRRPRVAVCIILILLTLGFGLSRLMHRSAKVRWARQDALPEIERLTQDIPWTGEGLAPWAAFKLAAEAERYIPDDPLLDRLWSRFSRDVKIYSHPPGASVYAKPYTDPDAEWRYLGQTPIESIRVPLGFSRMKLEMDDFRTIYDISWNGGFLSDTLRYELPEAGSLPNDMELLPDFATWFHITGAPAGLHMPGLEHLEAEQISDFLMDQHEVTNEAYKRFVDAGGYQNPKYWKYPFVKDGLTLAWEEAMALFTDKTGRPGPGTWEVRDYPDGRDDYPVTGISWYEAAAYAEFAGKSLPTIYHWDRASFTWASSEIVPLSNLNGDGPVPVGSSLSMNRFGIYDLAGNVREWCFNESSRSGERFILGGGWNDPAYAFNDAYAQSVFDRSETNGFRCIKYLESEGNRPGLEKTVVMPFRDFLSEEPVSDETFTLFLNQYAYDKTELNAVVESMKEEEVWNQEKITFDAAYGNERMMAYLFLPKHGTPPYQTVVYFPGSGAIHTRSSKSLGAGSNDFLLKSGRALMYPIYKSTYERGDDLKSDYPSKTNFWKEHVIMWAKDLSRSIDYLETRDDIDTDKLAYYGVSWGGAMGAIMPAVEKRIKVSVLLVAGLLFQRSLPEVEPVHFLPRIDTAVLMLNGKYDFFFPYETSQLPFHQLLGTPKEDKKLFTYKGGHSVPRTQLVKETLAWLDRYLGPVD